jgi:hypothetical protein
MEDKGFLGKNYIKLTHLPSFILIIGYFFYWMELYLIKRGRGLTSPGAWVLVICLLVYALYIKRKVIINALVWGSNAFRGQKISIKLLLVLSFVLSALIVIIVFLALLKPPHLPQEFDALNYHITLPRQHLILNSFKHIRWSSADLFPMPLQFSLAPYWLVGSMPNKFIHLFFIVGLAALSLSLVARLSKNNFLSLCLVTFAFLGSHAFGIQMPAVMLDIVICYLFVAFFDSLCKRAYLLSAIELSFLVWAKSFFPLLFIAITLIGVISYFLLKRFCNWRSVISFDSILIKFDKKILKKLIVFFILTSVIIAGPFIIKALYYAATPLYPFSPGAMAISTIDKDSLHWQSIVEKGEIYYLVKDNYGGGRSIVDFLQHFWLIAVPEKDVNNRYDYPLGLPYLLFLMPFFYLLFVSMRKKEFGFLPAFVVLYWIFWWFGSQQSRFLYIPLISIFIGVSASIKKPSLVFLSVLMFSLTFNVISISRANYKSIVSSTSALLRARDKDIINMNEKYIDNKRGDLVKLDFFDVAYAQFPVDVVMAKDEGDSLWVLNR